MVVLLSSNVTHASHMCVPRTSLYTSYLFGSSEKRLHWGGRITSCDLDFQG